MSINRNNHKSALDDKVQTASVKLRWYRILLPYSRLVTAQSPWTVAMVAHSPCRHGPAGTVAMDRLFSMRP